MLNSTLILSQLEIFLFGFQSQDWAERKPLVQLSFGGAAPSPAVRLHEAENENDTGGGLWPTLTFSSLALGICCSSSEGFLSFLSRAEP